MQPDLSDILPIIINNQDCGIIVLDKHLNTVLINDWTIAHANLHDKKLINQNILTIFPQITDQRLHIVITEALNLNRASILSQAIHNCPLPLYQDSKINGQNTLMQQRITVKPFSLNNESYCILQIIDLSAAVAKEYLLRATATKAKISREHAESLSKLKSEFVSTISHELRTPLTSISGSTALILGGAIGEISVAATEMLNIVQRNSDRLLHLINELLDIQKIESGTVDFEYQNKKLSPLITSCIEMNNTYANKYDVEYNFISDQDDYDVFIDEKRIS